MQHTSGEFEALLDEIEARLLSESDAIANGAVFTALLFEGLEAVDWVGLYFLRDDELVLGPFQGRAARSRLPVHHTVAGRAVSESRSVLVDDLSTISPDDEFPARSQIIVPVYVQDRIIGILQVDSPFVHRFADSDRIGLERAVAVFIANTDIATLTAKGKKISLDAKRKPAPQERRPAAAPKRAETVRGTAQLPPRAVDSWSDGQIESRSTRLALSRSRTVKRYMRRAFAIALALAVLAIALTGALSEFSVLGETTQHMITRRLISIALYSAVAVAINFGWRTGVRASILIMTLYSIIVQLAQAVLGSRDPLTTHIADLFCAALAGYIGAVCRRSFRRRTTR